MKIKVNDNLILPVIINIYSGCSWKGQKLFIMKLLVIVVILCLTFSVYAAIAGDWLQGPYVYYLYSQYGFEKGDIGQLFIAGFGSSMLFGTIVGSLADKQ